MSTEPTRRILQYKLPIGQAHFALAMPRGAKVLSIGQQDSLAYLWASVDETQRSEERFFRAVVTGEFFSEDRLQFIGRIQIGDGGYSWFIWEVDMGLEQLVPDTIEDRFFTDDIARIHEKPTDAVGTERRRLVAA